jgi:hypothetical protein
MVTGRLGAALKGAFFLGLIRLGDVFANPDVRGLTRVV